MQRLQSTLLLGGPLSADLVPEFCMLIEDNLVSLKLGGPTFKPKDINDLLGACVTVDNTKLLQLFTPDGVLGGFPILEIFALRHKLDYTLLSSGYIVNRPFIVESRGDLNFYFKANADRDFKPLIDGKILEELKQCTSQEEIQFILSEVLPDITPLREFFIQSPQHRKE